MCRMHSRNRTSRRVDCGKCIIVGSTEGSVEGKLIGVAIGTTIGCTLGLVEGSTVEIYDEVVDAWLYREIYQRMC